MLELFWVGHFDRRWFSPFLKLSHEHHCSHRSSCLSLLWTSTMFLTASYWPTTAVTHPQCLITTRLESASFHWLIYWHHLPVSNKCSAEWMNWALKATLPLFQFTASVQRSFGFSLSDFITKIHNIKINIVRVVFLKFYRIVTVFLLVKTCIAIHICPYI